MRHRVLTSILLAAALATAGCGSSGPARAPVAALSPAVTDRGQTVYFGSVFPLGRPAKEPTFVYERRVEERGGALVSTHITREPSGAIVLAESASHSPDYALSEYTLHTNQLGQSGTVRVRGTEITFRRVDAGKERSEVEHTTGPVVVGPTLVGYIVRHFGELHAKRKLPVRFAVLDRMETLGFELEEIPAAAGQTRIRLSPSSFLVGLVVDPVDFTFDAASGKLVRIEGRVPPKERAGDELRDFDARVEYRFVADTYR